MAAPEGSASFPGTITRMAEISIGWGITPAVGIVRIQPQDGLAVAPGPLTFRFGNAQRVLPDCLPIQPNLRTVADGTDWFWDIAVLDHRWRWSAGSIGGEYNIRRPDGTVDPGRRRTPAELATLLLSAMGETGFDVSRMPAGIWPYCKWSGGTPARYLAELCDKVACVITGGEVGRVVIYPRGIGAAMPQGESIAHPPFRFLRANRPGRLVFIGGDTAFQSKLKLEPRAEESNGDLETLEDVSYKPAAGWESELPFTLPGVDANNRPYGLGSVYRLFQATGQADGTLLVPGAANLPVTGIDQLLLGEHLIATGEDPAGIRHRLRAYIEGKFWPYTDDVLEHGEVPSRFVGPWQLLADRHAVKFPLPIFDIDRGSDHDNHQIKDPELYLVTSYRVRLASGNVSGFFRVRGLGGPGGDFVIRRPEVFESIVANYSQGQPTSLAGVTTTTAAATAEANRYLDIFARSFTDAPIEDQEFGGILPTALDGMIAQVKLSAGVDRVPTTRIGRVEEFDPYVTPALERRRREVLEQLKEHAL